MQTERKNVMPLVESSSYQPPIYLRNGHLQTIYPSLFRRVNAVPCQRERIDTHDGDFLDLDWSRVGGRDLGIISHGLEGNSQRHYVIGMARMLNRNGWDALAWNYRSCSGQINRRLRFYHNGAIDDLHAVVQHAQKSRAYRSVVLIGFSLGGNLTLVYLGDRGADISHGIAGAVVFSVPCDLAASAHELARIKCRLYMRLFLSSLHQKIQAKMQIMPGRIDDNDFHRIKNFKDYDDRYTAPLHGFKSAEDYWEKCSSLAFIPRVRVPALIVNALDDPFLAGDCYPRRAAAESNHVFLETPVSGGHVGFIQFNHENVYWSETRVLYFIQSHLTASIRCL
ncbi:MAG: alpha/beta hydrolase [Desulfobacteraceae bacterium]